MHLTCRPDLCCKHCPSSAWKHQGTAQAQLADAVVCTCRDVCLARHTACKAGCAPFCEFEAPCCASGALSPSGSLSLGLTKRSTAEEVPTAQPKAVGSEQAAGQTGVLSGLQKLLKQISGIPLLPAAAPKPPAQAGSSSREGDTIVTVQPARHAAAASTEEDAREDFAGQLSSDPFCSAHAH